MRRRGVVFLLLSVGALGLVSLSLIAGLLWEPAALASGAGPVAWWRFDEQHGRIALNQATGAGDWVHDNFGRPDWRPGVVGNALFFDGYSTWIESGFEAAFENGFTVASWVAVFAYPGSPAPVVNRQTQQADGRRLGFFFGVYPLGEWGLEASVAGRWSVCRSPEPLPKGSWVHVAATFDPEAGMALYLNGEQVCQNLEARGSIHGAPGAKLLIGRHNETPYMHRLFPTGMFHGLMDELKIYDRALSPAEVRALYLENVPQSEPWLGVRWERLDDPHRPQYHFLPPVNWMNEPHAPIYWKGRYHIFYQFNPHGPYWGNIHWGHAVSEDLVHWTHLPIALAPEPGPDSVGVWSGSTIAHEDQVVALYSGEQLPYQVINYAASSDDLLRTWEKHPGNPIVARPPRGFALVSGFRDPFIWREGEHFYMLVGSGIAGAGGTAFLYRSDDLVHWEYRGPLLVGNAEESGVMWEMPQFFPLGDKHVLLVNVWPTNRDVFYWVGTWDNETFTPERFGRLDYGGHYLSPSVLVEEDGRVLLFGFIKESNGGEAQLENGWSGVMALPRTVFLREDGTLGLRPVDEVTALRGAYRGVSDVTIPPAGGRVLHGFQGDQFEVIATFDPGEADWVGLRLRQSKEGTGLMREETLLYYDALRGRVELDRRRSTLLPTAERDVVWAPFELEEGEPLTFRVFVDRSVVEVFVNDHLALTTRVYPVRENSVVLDVFAQGGTARLLSLDFWEMKSIWSDESFAHYPVWDAGSPQDGGGTP